MSLVIVIFRQSLTVLKFPSRLKKKLWKKSVGNQASVNLTCLNFSQLSKDGVVMWGTVARALIPSTGAAHHGMRDLRDMKRTGCQAMPDKCLSC